MGAARLGVEGRDLAGAAAAAVRPENTAAGQKTLREKLIAEAAALVPLLRAKAAEIEREGRIPDEVLAAIDAAQLFRLRTPARFGGFEADIRTYMDVVAELGRGCGSTSWVAFISIATVWIAALFPDEAQHDVFAGNPDVRFMGALGMTARARAADGGFIVDGKWAYASNACMRIGPCSRRRFRGAKRSPRASCWCRCAILRSRIRGMWSACAAPAVIP